MSATHQRKDFADAEHYGSYLALFDAVDRLRSACESTTIEAEAFYRHWANRSLEKAARLLGASSVDRSPLHSASKSLSRKVLNVAIDDLSAEVGIPPVIRTPICSQLFLVTP